MLRTYFDEKFGDYDNVSVMHALFDGFLQIFQYISQIFWKYPEQSIVSTCLFSNTVRNPEYTMWIELPTHVFYNISQWEINNEWKQKIYPMVNADTFGVCSD